MHSGEDMSVLRDALSQPGERTREREIQTDTQREKRTSLIIQDIPNTVASHDNKAVVFRDIEHLDLRRARHQRIRRLEFEICPSERASGSLGSRVRV